MGEAKRRGTYEQRVATAKPETKTDKARRLMHEAFELRRNEAVAALLQTNILPAKYMTSMGRLFNRSKKIKE